jgi:PAS domain S-box-containing protein
LKKRRKAERRRAKKREGVQPRSAATTPRDKALRESEAKFRSLVENTAVPIGITDSKGEFAYVNKALADSVGYTVQELVGRPFMDFLHPEDRERVLSTFMRGVSTSKEAPEIEFRVTCRDGQTLTLTSKPTRLEVDGKTVGFQAIITDITERKRMKESLRNGEEEYRELAESISDVFFAMDKNLRYTYWNKASENLTGISAKDAIGRSLYELFPDVKGTRAEEVYLEVIRTGQSKSFVNEYELDSKQFLFEISAYPTKRGISVFTRDITERKRMQDELQRYSTLLEKLVFERTKKLAESERRFRELADLLPQIVFEIDENGNVQYVNRAGFAATGLSEEDYRRGLNASDMLASAEHDRAVRGMRRIMGGEMIGEREFTVLRRDGTSFPAAVYTAPIVREGKTVGLRGIAVDITQRKRMEEEIRASKERLDYVITSNPAVILTGKPHSDLKDFDTAYISGNVASILGYEPKEFTDDPKFWERHIHPEDVPRVLSELPRLFRDGHAAYEYRFLHRDGTYRWILEDTKVTRDPAGNPAEVIGYLTDITERKRTEEKVRAASLYARNLIEVSLDPLVTIRPDGKITDVNKATELVTEVSRDQLIGSDFSDYFTDPEKARRGYEEAFVKGFVKHYALAIRDKSGKVTDVLYNATVYRDETGEVQGVFAAARDISERKRMEAHLADARRLAVIGETTAMVGHDLRNPLQAIVSTIYLAKRKLESPPEPSGKPAVEPGLVDMLETIENEAYYMNKIVSDLQDYATPLKAEPKPVQMESLVKDTLLKIRIPQNVKVSFKVSEALQTVMIDPAILRRVFSNLIMNAIQAMPDGGELTIDLSRTEEDLLVSFRDTGVGIPEENMGKLFNPFFTTKAKGQGLGLPVCKRLVEAQNGCMTVESKPGEGSTFTVKLPLVKP